MKVVIINTSEHTGGAAIAANRLMHALNNNGVHTRMLVRDKQTNDENVITINTSWSKKKINYLRFVWERLIIFINNKFSRRTLFQVSIANTGTDMSNHPLIKEADIIHLHWINQGFLSLKDINKLTRLGKPVVWTMHDMWPSTGICHHSYGCDQYTQSCGQCPFLKSINNNDLSHKVLLKKQSLFGQGAEMVAVSSWLKDLATKSSLYQNKEIHTIPNLLDISVFKPEDKIKCRRELKFPLDKKILVMGAANLGEPIKGFDLLNQSLEQLSQKEDFLLVLFGGIKNNDSFFDKIKIPYIYFGKLDNTNTIAKLYNSADATVVPSLYETFGQTIIESMACGCPVVSFDNSGQTDIINHKVNGYLAKYRDITDFSNGIEWAIDNTEPLKLKEECIKKVESGFSEQIVTAKYISLYKKLLNR